MPNPTSGKETWFLTDSTPQFQLHSAASSTRFHGHDYQHQEMEGSLDSEKDSRSSHNRSYSPRRLLGFHCHESQNQTVFGRLSPPNGRSFFGKPSGPLSAMHVLALDGLNAMIQGMADMIGNDSPAPEQTASSDLEEYNPFWTVKCENYDDPKHWVAFVHKMKFIKKRLMIGVDHFNRDPKKGLEFLQGMHLLPDELDPKSVAYFFRYTTGLDKNLVGDFLGNHDEFCIQVLHEFAGAFDFQGMNLDTALRVFLENFRLPGESQKIQRVLEAFAERYYEQSPHVLAL